MDDEPRNLTGYLPSLLGPVLIQGNGVDMPPRPTLNFIGTVTDNPITDATDIAGSGGGGGTTPTGTGFVHVTGGTQDAAAALVLNADVDPAAAIAGSKLQAAASGNTGAIQLAQDIGGTATAPTVVGISGAPSTGKVTHAETYHELLTANQRLRDERFEFSLTGSADVVWSLTMPTGESWVVDYELVAHIVGGGNTNLYRATRKIKNVAGTLTVTTIGTDTASEDLAGTIDYTTTGTTVRLRYTKPAGTWRAVGRVTIDGAVA